ncbi:hypothetical protein D3C75_909890 [compost metagenome]
MTAAGWRLGRLWITPGIAAPRCGCSSRGPRPVAGNLAGWPVASGAHAGRHRRAGRPRFCRQPGGGRCRWPSHPDAHAAPASGGVRSGPGRRRPVRRRIPGRSGVGRVAAGGGRGGLCRSTSPASDEAVRGRPGGWRRLRSAAICGRGRLRRGDAWRGAGRFPGGCRVPKAVGLAGPVAGTGRATGQRWCRFRRLPGSIGAGGRQARGGRFPRPDAGW